jgi:hypothetical protein
MQRMAVGSVLILLGLPLVLVSVFVDAAAASETGEYAFGWEQKAGVVLGCAVIWFACVVASGWRPHAAKVAGRTWLELSQTDTIRGLGVVQALVILVSALGVLAFTSLPWYVALLVGLVLSVALNIALFQRSRSMLSRERRGRSR